MSDTRTDDESRSNTSANANGNADTDPAVTQLFLSPDNTQEAFLSVVGLSKAEARAYVAVVNHPNSTVNHLADDVLERDPNYVTRPLRGLCEMGLIEREKKTLENGGIGHIYSPIPSEEVEQYFHDQLKNWIGEMGEEVRRLDERVGVDAVLEELLIETESESVS